MADEQIDERAFHPAFLAGCTVLELAALQHDLRQFPEDEPYLRQVLEEFRRRAVRRRAVEPR